ncbi:MAG: DUF2304 domain-containing protein [Firmicutes bacterium]|nr:DUF2304 domain-containing protein [Bacillota bacterium]
MLNIRLIILMFFLCFIFGLNIIYYIFKRKLSLQYSLMWFLYMTIMLIVLISSYSLKYIAHFFGFKLISNMIFFFGFIILIYIAFTLTIIISKQKEMISKLIQEVACLKKEIEDKND